MKDRVLSLLELVYLPCPLGTGKGPVGMAAVDKAW